MNPDWQSKEVGCFMARKSQIIEVVVYAPTDIDRIFDSPEGKEFWQNVIRKKIRDNHLTEMEAILLLEKVQNNLKEKYGQAKRV